MAEEDPIVPLKLGIRSQPPALTLLYSRKSKERCRIMPVKFLNKYGGVEGVVTDLKSRHSAFLKEVS